MRLTPCLIALSIASASGLAVAEESAVKLPDIGSSAATIMSPQDLHDYGAGMLQELRGYGLVLDDALLSDYINALGYRLVANSAQPEGSFTFFMLRDENINAFAAPGGFVAVNAGLVTAMESEDQLAAVVAHEISHVEQLHILRAFEDQKIMSIPIMLGMLGVMIATAHRTDDAGLAALVTGTAMMKQRQINFTRSEEAEADRIGIQTLARAGFDPNAMAGAFQTLQKLMRVNGIDIPEFLLDHPLDTRRIAEAKARAEQLGCPKLRQLELAPESPQGQLNLSVPVKRVMDVDTGTAGGSTDASEATIMTVDSLSAPSAPGAEPTLPRVTVTTCDPGGGPGEPYFELMRERVRVLAAESAPDIRTYYANNLRDNSEFDTIANRYGYALALTRTLEPKRAIEELGKIPARESTSPVLRLALANAQDQAGERVTALKTFAQLEHEFPGSRAVALTYADALLTHPDVGNARTALDLLRPLLERYSDDPDLQRSFGRANQLAGDKVRAAEAYAEAAFLTGHAEDALNQLKALSKQSDLTYYQRSRIDARMTQMTPAVLDLRKRSSPTEPDQQLAPSFSCCGHEWGDHPRLQ